MPQHTFSAAALFLLCFSLSILSAAHAQLYPPTGAKGPYLWPQPRTITSGPDSSQVMLLPDYFEFDLDDGSATNNRMFASVDRAKQHVFPFPIDSRLARRKVDIPEITVLTIRMLSDKDVLGIEVDESYLLEVDTDGVYIEAETVFGVIWALETFAQLVQYEEGMGDFPAYYAIPNLPIHIEDAPEYAWRGLMVDTSRHFLTTSTLKSIIDAMGMHKLNVFHWHAFDSDSVPMQSSTYPGMAYSASYRDTEQYSYGDIQNLIAYGHDRGVAVMVEVDVPGHSAGLAWWDNSLTPCTDMVYAGYPSAEYVVLDPTLQHTYDVIKALFDEYAQTFSFEFIHFGGNDLSTQCLNSSAAIRDWMVQKGMGNDFNKLFTYFWSQVNTQILPDKALLNRSAVFFADSNWKNYYSAIGTEFEPVFQVYGDADATTIQAILDSGYSVVNSIGYDLTEKNEPFGEKHLLLDQWVNFYQLDPLGGVRANQEQFLGAEALMWSEQMSDETVNAWLWPRVSGIAERLWTQNVSAIDDYITYRMNQNFCRLKQRRIGASPLRPGYCDSAPAPTHSTTIDLSIPVFGTIVALASVGGLWILATILRFFAFLRQNRKKIGALNEYNLITDGGDQGINH